MGAVRENFSISQIIIEVKRQMQAYHYYYGLRLIG